MERDGLTALVDAELVHSLIEAFERACWCAHAVQRLQKAHFSFACYLERLLSLSAERTWS